MIINKLYKSKNNRFFNKINKHNNKIVKIRIILILNKF